MQSKSTGPQADDRTITVKGQRLHIAIRSGSGTRTPLLLMNGIGANLELLQPFVDQLDPAIEVIRFDVPGVGGSPPPATPYRFSTLAWLLTKMLDQLGYKQVDVLGFSWGGGLAQQFAIQYPRRCRRLILVSTGMGAIMVPGRPSVIIKLASPRRYMDPSHMAEISSDLYGGSVQSNPELVRELAHSMRWGGPRGYFYQFLGGVGWTSLPWLRFLRQPTLIMSGDDDPMVPPINAKIMHHLIPRSKLHIFHDGHLGLVLKAKEVAHVIEQFLIAPASQGA